MTIPSEDAYLKTNKILKTQKALISEGFCIFKNQEAYFLNLAYLVLNLSILPAVSSNLDFPV